MRIPGMEPKLDDYLELNACRLCRTVNPEQMVIMCFGNAVYEANAIKFPVAEVLNQHFWFELRCERNANAFVCPPCWAKVEEFHEFYQSVQNRYPPQPQTTRLKCHWANENTHFQVASAADADNAELVPDFEHADIIEERIEDDGDGGDDVDNSREGDTTNNCTEEIAAANDDVDDPANDCKSAVRAKLGRLAAATSNAQPNRPAPPRRRVDDSVLLAQHFTMQCDMCAESLASLVAARQHYKERHELPGHLTCRCGKRFKRMATILEHCEFHASAALHKCVDCCSVFSSDTRLAAHMRRVHGKGAGGTHDYHSPAASAARLRSLEAHSRSRWLHPRRTERGFECCDCDRAFADEAALRAHQQHTHQPDVFECFDCKRRYADAVALRQHMRMRHRPPAWFECSVCDMRFKSAKWLAKHSALHGDAIKCEHCPKRFLRQFELESHQRIHRDERPFVCEVCGAAFKRLGTLREHRRSRHLNEEKYGCEVCGRTFKRKRLLDYHTKVVHTGERPLECPTCRARFVYPGQFRKHLRIHTGEKPYACEICGKTFNSGPNLVTHRFVHSAKKQYECAVCGAGFMRKPQLLGHMKEQGHESDTIVMNKPDGMFGVVVSRGEPEGEEKETTTAEQRVREAQEQETRQAVKELVAG